MKRSYVLTKLEPDSVRRSLRRACRKSLAGAVDLELVIKEGQGLPPELESLGNRMEVATCGSVYNGCLEIFDPRVSDEEIMAEADFELYLPVEAIESCRVNYIP